MASGKSRISTVISFLGPLLGLAFVMGVFISNPEVRPYFLSGANFKIVFTQTVIVAVCALGMTLIIVGGGIDLSLGSVVALTVEKEPVVGGQLERFAGEPIEFVVHAALHAPVEG